MPQSQAMVRKLGKYEFSNSNDCDFFVSANIFISGFCSSAFIFRSEKLPVHTFAGAMRTPWLSH
jgi:hypothetical protein